MEASTSVEESHGPEKLWMQTWAVGRSCSGLVQDCCQETGHKEQINTRNRVSLPDALSATVWIFPLLFHLFSEAGTFFLEYLNLKEIKVLGAEAPSLLFRALGTFTGGDALCSDPFYIPKSIVPIP